MSHFHSTMIGQISNFATIPIVLLAMKMNASIGQRMTSVRKHSGR